MGWAIVFGILSFAGFSAGSIGAGLLCGVICVILLFSKKTPQNPPKDPAQEVYKALDQNANPNQEELIRRVFALADKNGGMWRVSFTSNLVTLYQKEKNSHYFVTLSELGYGELDLNKSIRVMNGLYCEFPYRLRRAAESRGYLYWSEKRSAVSKGSTYTSYDGGHSYSRDSSFGEVITSVNVCSKEYYSIYRPYTSSNQPPLKQL